jgi:hypothetical protein
MPLCYLPFLLFIDLLRPYGRVMKSVVCRVFVMSCQNA